MATLYRKYRPQNFSQIVGQNHIKITLEQEVKTGRIAHAYLFCGPRAVGKTTVARVLAKALNCQNRQAGEHEPCDRCDNCRQIVDGRSFDVIEIDAASHTGVDNVRENVIAASRVLPVSSNYKVFIIDEVHMLSISAFNSLLKIIEEPPAHIIFILCTTEVNKVPATIISRCQRFDFKRISVNEITNKLSYIANKEGVAINRNILESIARHSEGHMRDAESLLGQVVSIGGKEITAEEADLVIPRSNLSEAVNLIGFLAKKDAGSAIGLINKLLDEGINLNRYVIDVIELLRKLMFFKLNPALGEKFGLALGETLEASLNKLSSGMDLEQIISSVEKLMAVKNEIKASFIAQLPFELAIAELCVSSPKLKAFYSPAQSVPKAPGSSGGERSAARADAANPAADGPIEKDLFFSKWGEVLARIKKYNHSLSLILRVCRPTEAVNGRLLIIFKYRFHKDRISEPAMKTILENVLAEVYGSPIAVEAVVDESLELSQAPAEPLSSASFPGSAAVNEPSAENNSGAKEEGKSGSDNLIDNLLKTFGGKVIN